MPAQRPHEQQRGRTSSSPHRFFIPSSTSQYSRRRSPSRPDSRASSGCCSKNLRGGAQGQGNGARRITRLVQPGAAAQRTATHVTAQPTPCDTRTHRSLRSGSRAVVNSSFSASMALRTTSRAPGGGTGRRGGGGGGVGRRRWRRPCSRASSRARASGARHAIPSSSRPRTTHAPAPAPAAHLLSWSTWRRVRRAQAGWPPRRPAPVLTLLPPCRPWYRCAAPAAATWRRRCCAGSCPAQRPGGGKGTRGTGQAEGACVCGGGGGGDWSEGRARRRRRGEEKVSGGGGCQARAAHQRQRERKGGIN